MQPQSSYSVVKCGDDWVVQAELGLGGWEDRTDWPGSLAGSRLTAVSLAPRLEPQDERTGKAVESYRAKLAEQNCGRDAEMRYCGATVTSIPSNSLPLSEIPFATE